VQSIALLDSTTGATIYFTTDGTTPTANSARYTGLISIAVTTTLKAIAIAPNYGNSSVLTATYTLLLQPTATPAFSPAAGTYNTAQSVVISDATPNATIYYTTDGSTPTSLSAVYSGPITVSANETLRAVAIASGYSVSSYISAAYTIAQSALATPTFSVAAGTYSTAQTVAISDTATNATICYTTDGSTPTSASAVYSGPISVSATETLKAVAYKSGYTQSEVATAVYTISQSAVSTPAFSPAAGTYSTTQSVTIFTTTSNAAIYFTTNGSTPTTASTLYTGPISVSSTETLQAIAIVSGSSPSAVASAAYTITQSATATPSFYPAAGSYSTAQSVAISDATPNATIYYTIDGSTPTSLSAVYSGPITVSASETLRAVAIASGYSVSSYTSAAYTIAQPVVATPTFSVATGVFTAPQTVVISDATPATTICYTTDGSTPTSASAVYSGPISVSATETLTAVAYKSGYTQSATASATYVFPITPTITWPTPATIAYGTPLSTIQLDATASVAGSFSYTPAPGTVLPVGSNTLSVAFVPKNQTNYTTATASVTLTVTAPINSVPVIVSISPAFVNAGSSDFTLTVNGSGFDAGSTVYWGSTALVTKVVSSVQLTATVPAQSVASPGVFAVLVQTPAPGGGASTALQFEVDSNAAGTILPPTISSTTVAVTAGSSAVYSVTLPSNMTALTVSCLNLPVGASCTYSTTSHQVIITTSPNTPKGVYQITVVFASTSTIPVSTVMLLPIFLLPLAFAGRRRKGLLTASLSLILLASTLIASGCGDSISQSVNSTASSLVTLAIQ
jgi:hypothetical protein